MWREKLFALQIHAYNEVEIDAVKRFIIDGVKRFI